MQGKKVEVKEKRSGIDESVRCYMSEMEDAIVRPDRNVNGLQLRHFREILEVCNRDSIRIILEPSTESVMHDE